MNVLSLFDGMSCGRVALERANIKVAKYYASEIDKYAIQVSQNNYPDIIRLGDINNWESWDIDWSSIDLILAGSPCQGFSFAGKQLAFDDERSALFFRFAEILSHVQSLNSEVKFLLENVRMKKDYEKVITSIVGVDPVMINSALVSAQNRKRLYWCNWNVEQPEDKGILLKDILLNGEALTDKSQTILSTLHKENAKSMLKRKKMGLIVSDHLCSDAWLKWWRKNGNFQIQKKYSCICNHAQKAITLTTRQYASWGGNFYQLGDNKFRKLTPIECERLQTLPGNYTEGVSNTQRYKMLGNGWTVDVIAHILRALK